MIVNSTTLRLSFASGKRSFERSQLPLPNNEWFEMLRRFEKWPQLQSEAIRGYTHGMYADLHKERDMVSRDVIQKQIDAIKPTYNSIAKIGDIVLVQQPESIGIEKECQNHLAEVIEFAQLNWRNNDKALYPVYRMLDTRLRAATFIDRDSDATIFHGRIYGDEICYYDEFTHVFMTPMYPWRESLFRYGTESPLTTACPFKVDDEVRIHAALGAFKEGYVGTIAEVFPDMYIEGKKGIAYVWMACGLDRPTTYALVRFDQITRTDNV